LTQDFVTAVSRAEDGRTPRFARLLRRQPTEAEQTTSGFANPVLFARESSTSSTQSSSPRNGFENLPGSPSSPQTKDAEEKYGDANAHDLDVELTVAACPDEQGAQYDSEKAEESVFDNNEKAASASDDFAGGLVGSIDAERDVAQELVSRKPGAAFKVFGASALLNDACDFIVT
jgi:hypothetical protein